MKITRENLARAIANTERNPFGVMRAQSYDHLEHWKKLHYLCKADDVIRALQYLKEQEIEGLKQKID